MTTVYGPDPAMGGRDHTWSGGERCDARVCVRVRAFSPRNISLLSPKKATQKINPYFFSLRSIHPVQFSAFHEYLKWCTVYTCTTSRYRCLAKRTPLVLDLGALPLFLELALFPHRLLLLLLHHFQNSQKIQNSQHISQIKSVNLLHQNQYEFHSGTHFLFISPDKKRGRFDDRVWTRPGDGGGDHTWSGGGERCNACVRACVFTSREFRSHSNGSKVHHSSD